MEQSIFFVRKVRFHPSAQVTDMINGLQGEVLMATPLVFRPTTGIWSTQHINLNNVSEGLINNYVTALEYDASGNLWIGYGNGIQIYNGHDYTSNTGSATLKKPPDQVSPALG